MLAMYDKLLASPWFVRAAGALTLLGAVTIFHSAIGLFGHGTALTGVGVVAVVLGAQAFVSVVRFRIRLRNAAQLCRNEIERNRAVMGEGLRLERYWPYVLGTAWLREDGTPLLADPGVYQLISDANVVLFKWNDRLVGAPATDDLRGTPIQGADAHQIRVDLVKLQAASQALDRLVAELSRGPLGQSAASTG